MLINLPEDLIIKILLFSYNSELFELYKTCNRFKNIMNNNSFKNIILSRNHPLVFNSDDLYCHKCNLKIYKINTINLENNIWCKH